MTKKETLNAPFRDEEIAEFVEDWEFALRPPAADLIRDYLALRAKVRELRDRAYREWQGSPDERELTENPRLLFEELETMVTDD